MLFLGSLAELENLVIECLYFAHSSLIVRSSFAEGLNRKIFCWGIDKNFVRLTCSPFGKVFLFANYTYLCGILNDVL